MIRFNWRRAGALGVGALAIAACVGIVAAGQASTSAKKYPPQFPREGATKLFENDRVIIWEQIGRPKQPFVHKHIRDIITFGIRNGRVDVLNEDGSKAQGGGSAVSMTTRVYPGSTTGGSASGSVSYSKAGLGPHIETAPDPTNVPKSIFVELKGTEPKDCAQWSTACQ